MKPEDHAKQMAADLMRRHGLKRSEALRIAGRVVAGHGSLEDSLNIDAKARR